MIARELAQFAAALFVLCFGACIGNPVLEAPKPARAPTCAGVCENYRRLGCAAGRETVDGDTCEEVCGMVQGSGLVEFDLTCRANAKSCSQADACD